MKTQLKKAYNAYTSCKKTERPLNSRKIFFSRILIGFIDTAQLAFFVSDRTKNSILHVRDSATAFSATHILPLREVARTMNTFERIWIDIYSSPHHPSVDSEFF